MFKDLKKIKCGFDLKNFSGYADQEGMCVLHSGKEGLKDEKWTIVGLKPVRKTRPPLTTPYQGGALIGYLAYPNIGLKNDIPDQRFYEFDSLLIHNNQTDEVFIMGDVDFEEKTKKLSYKTSGKLHQSFSESEYLKKIEQIKELLSAGEVYQINFALRFRKKFSGSPYALFLKLAEVNPVDFQAFLNCGKFQIISSSPERFFKVLDDKITTQPIKGTVSKRGGQKNLDYLINSEKEQAELDMITDLERNDVGKICEYGTLNLKKEREILELRNLWHCYSEVEGKLRSDASPEEVIEAMFPGGSITGCPKKRAMEYISELEGLPRNIYTGSVGYISGSGANCGASGGHNTPNNTPNNWIMDFNIAIRTVLIKNGMMEFWAGGGIVADSDPEKEYKECLLKAERFLDII